MVISHIRRKTGSGNVDGHTRRAMREMDVACKQPAFPTAMKKGGGREHGRCTICPTAKDREADWKCHCSEWVYNDNCIKTIQITCNNCKKQSYQRQISFTFMF